MPTSFARLLTAGEVAELLGMSESWVRRNTQPKGAIPCVRLGDNKNPAVRYKISEIEAFVSGFTQPEKTFGEQATN